MFSKFVLFYLFVNELSLYSEKNINEYLCVTISIDRQTASKLPVFTICGNMLKIKLNN